MKIPEGLSTVGDGKVTLTGDSSPYTLSGNYSVDSGSYVYNFDQNIDDSADLLTSQYLPKFIKNKSESSLLLDLDVETKKPIQADVIMSGSKVSVPMLGELKVFGEIEQLKANGTIKSYDQGTLLFRDNNFDLNSVLLTYNNKGLSLIHI